MTKHEMPRTRKSWIRERTVFKTSGPSRTQQHFKQECDINQIMAKYEKTGTVSHLAKYQGQYGDFAIIPDFHTAMDTMLAAQEMFMELPAKVRERFGNDAGEFVEFATKKENLDELREMGLAPKLQEKTAEKPQKIEEEKPQKKAEEPKPDQKSS